MVTISATWPMLIAGVTQFTGRPICVRYRLVQKKYW